MSVPNVVACARCNVALVPVQKRPMVSVGGAIGAVLIAAALVALLAGEMGIAIVLAVVGVLCSALSEKVTVMTCPQCGAAGKTLS